MQEANTYKYRHHTYQKMHFVQQHGIFVSLGVSQLHDCICKNNFQAGILNSFKRLYRKKLYRVVMSSRQIAIFADISVRSNKKNFKCYLNKMSPQM